MSQIKAVCPICDGNISVDSDLQESEIISCTECQNRIVVESIKEGKAVLGEAPEIEEDWGE